MAEKRIFRIFRYQPERSEKPYYDEFEIEVHEGMTVLDALNYIHWKIDGTLAYRRSCRSEICGSCAVRINGKNRLACKTQVLFLKGKVITIEPLPGLPVIKDLVVDFDPFFRNLERVKPYLIRYSPDPEEEHIQYPEQRELIAEPVLCILCGACTTSCPSFWANEEYLGPAALLKAYRFIFDSRDEGTKERLDIINDKNGLWRCHAIFNCVEACPKDINITYYIKKLQNLAVDSEF